MRTLIPPAGLALLITLLFVSAASAEPLGSRTFDQAYDQAPANVTTVIDVPDGSYPDPALTGTKPLGTEVVFRGASQPTLSYITLVGNNHVEFDGFRSGGFHIKGSSVDVTIRNHFSTSRVFITDSYDVSVIDSTIDGAGQYWTNGSQVKTAASGGPTPTRTVFDGVTFKNFRKDPATSNHVDCLHLMAGDTLTVRNSRFENCEAFGVLSTTFLDPAVTHLTVEDSTFGTVQGFYAFQLGGGHGEIHNDVLVQRNVSTDAPFTTGTDNTLINVRFLNNQATVSGCTRSGVTCTNNGPSVNPTPTPTPSPTPTPTPVPVYAPACEPTCDEQIADLNALAADLRARVKAFTDWLALAPQ